MSRYRQAVVITCVLTFSPCCAFGQRCAYSEGPVESCGSPRVIPGAPGHHVVYVDTTDSTTPGNLCGSSVTNVAWFEVYPTVSGPLTISTCHPLTSYDTVLAVYSGGNNECQGWTEEACNDDDPAEGCDNGCSSRSSTVTIPNALAGTRYRFAVSEYAGSSSMCTNCLGVIVTIGTPCGDPPTNLICELAEELPGYPGTHEAQIDAVNRILEKLGYLEIPRLLVFNKIDLLGPEALAERLAEHSALAVSATRKTGIQEFLAAIDDALPPRAREPWQVVPPHVSS